jgi:hypothetical protein
VNDTLNDTYDTLNDTINDTNEPINDVNEPINEPINYSISCQTKNLCDETPRKDKIGKSEIKLCFTC